jgi:hypothetical protein
MIARGIVGVGSAISIFPKDADGQADDACEKAREWPLEAGADGGSVSVKVFSE